jgi:hypothetical protein
MRLLSRYLNPFFIVNVIGYYICELKLNFIHKRKISSLFSGTVGDAPTVYVKEFLLSLIEI